MQHYAANLSRYERLKTKEVNVGGLLIGNGHPIRVQTMTTTDTMDTIATVDQTIRCIEAGSELVRITAPSKKEAENLLNIKNELHKKGYSVPLVADIHFTPNAAEIAARIVEKVRINPGNYIDKKKFELLDYTDKDYQEELERIRHRFTPLIKICKEYGTAMRIGTNHGSLSDRIMSRYGDTPIGMVESAMEFLRIARSENYHNIVLSMKASNPIVMVEAYRLLIRSMHLEFEECYALHLGVTEAGDGEDGRVKSAVGMGTLLEDGIGDTIRVSLTEDPELEIPVCNNLIKRYTNHIDENDSIVITPPSNFSITGKQRRSSQAVGNIGGNHVPVVISDFSQFKSINAEDLQSIDYFYRNELDKWDIGDLACDYIYLGKNSIDFSLPGTLKAIVDFTEWQHKETVPLFTLKQYTATENRHNNLNFVSIQCPILHEEVWESIRNAANDDTVVFVLHTEAKNAMQTCRGFFWELLKRAINSPVIIHSKSNWHTADEHLIHFSCEAGGLLLDGYGDGVFLTIQNNNHNKSENLLGRNYNDNSKLERFRNTTAFSILQATRSRISKTEYISCPSCGRTLFDLQETTAKIRAVTNHLKGVKIAIMGCIVNGPGEMADADFGYVGSGVGKITLYKGKDIVRKGIDSEVAVDELINLLKENNVWVEPVAI